MDIVTTRPRSTNDSRRRTHRGSIHLRLARPEDRDFFFTTRRAALGPYAEELWGWDDAHQRSLADKEFDELPVEIIEESGELVGYLRPPPHGPRLHRRARTTSRGAGSRHWVVACPRRDGGRQRAGRSRPLERARDKPARRLYEGLGFRVSSIEYPRVKMEWRAEPPR